MNIKKDSGTAACRPSGAGLRALAGSAALAALLACVPAQADYLAYAVGEKARLPLPESIDAIDARYLVNLDWGEAYGGRSRVAVLPVDNTSAASTLQMVTDQGQAVVLQAENIGMVPVNGIEAIVTDVMSRTGRFRLVERTALASILQEQDLVTSDRVTTESGARTGNVLGAEYLVQVVVTDYEAKVSGRGGGGLGGLVGGAAGSLIGGLSVKSDEGRVGMNFRLIDAETSEVVYTKQIESNIRESGLNFGGLAIGGGAGLGGFLGSFSKTPIGQAVIAGANKGIYDLIREIGVRPASGSVVRAEGGRIWTNLGSSSVSVGDVLEVVSRGEELIDPETGISLGSMDTNLGTARVAQVQEQFSVADEIFISGEVKRGDRIVSTAMPPALQFAHGWEEPRRGQF